MPRLPIIPEDLFIAGTSKPDRVAIAALLRGEEEITLEVRNWLADLFFSPARIGRPRAAALPHAEAVEDYRWRLESTNPKRAIAETCDRYRITRSTLLAADKVYREGEEENARLIAEEVWPRHPNEPFSIDPKK